MNLVSLKIPYDFIQKRVTLTWRDVLFGIDKNLLAPDAPVKLAIEQLETIREAPNALVSLAILEKWDSARPHVGELARDEPEGADEVVRSKWLYLVLAWIFEHKGDYADPLETVEKVYADFNYPPRIACFVRYMPSDHPSLGSRELNENHLYNNWKAYLDEAFRKEFLNFVRSIAERRYTSDAWQKYAVNHYQDTELEDIRIKLVKLSLKDNFPVSEEINAIIKMLEEIIVP